MLNENQLVLKEYKMFVDALLVIQVHFGFVSGSAVVVD